MASDSAGFEAAYAQAASARCAWVSRAASSAELIAKLGLMGAGDRLVACADAPDAFERHLGWHGLSLIADPSPDAFIAAGAAAVDGPAASDAAEPFARASYAYAAGACPGRTFWYVDMLCGPVLRMADVRALGRAARMAGVTLIVGNSVPTVACCRPLELGAHVAIEDLSPLGCPGCLVVSVGRSVARRGRHQVADPAAEDAYRMLARSLGEPGGAVPSSRRLPEDLLLHAVSSLPVLLDVLQPRMDAARAVAEYLACHPRVGRVSYPGLSSHPDRGHAANVLMHGFGTCVSFTLLGGERSREAAETESLRVALRHRFAPCELSVDLAEGPGGVSRIILDVRSDDALGVIDGLDGCLRQSRS